MKIRKGIGGVSSLLIMTLLSFSLLPDQITASNILGIFTAAPQSLLIRHMSMVIALAERGHNVTVVSSIVPKVMHDGIDLIVIPPTTKNDNTMNEIMASVARSEIGVTNALGLIYRLVTTTMEIQFEALNDQRFTDLYEIPRKPQFDIVLVGFFINDYQLGMGAKFGCPVMLHYPEESNEWVYSYIGNPTNNGFMPSVNLVINPGTSMSFLERAANAVFINLALWFKCFMSFRMENYYRRLFPNENFIPYSEAIKNISIAFTDSHFTEGQIYPRVPALIDIGGIQVKKIPAPLPEDIAYFLAASSKHGAILFCLGADINTSNLKIETVTIIYNVLSNLKQNVIWKWDDLDKTPGNSSNILYSNWLPQDDILSHPNLKLLITHAGKGSFSEAIYHGVPMLAIPIFADQFRHGAQIEAFDYGLQMSLSKLTGLNFHDNIMKILTDPTYTENVRKASKLYRDRPISARDSVIYWTEYAIRHRGAKHMQSPLVHLNAIQKGNWDVCALFALILYLIIKLIRLLWRVLRRILLACRKRPSESEPTSINKKEK